MNFGSSLLILIFNFSNLDKIFDLPDWSETTTADPRFIKLTDNSLVLIDSPNSPKFSTRNPFCFAIDYGIKRNILRYFSDFNCKVTVVSCKTSSEEILQLKPNGIFLSNGPGDPAATGKYAIKIIQDLIKTSLPIFGICLGHQIIALALGAKTKKMKFGHRGANHPVKNLINGSVEITSQNHGFEVTKENLPKNIDVTHTSLFDGSIEGIKLKNKPVFSVQYHPESNPGPQDSVYLFKEFIKEMKKYAKKKRS